MLLFGPLRHRQAKRNTAGRPRNGCVRDGAVGNVATLKIVNVIRVFDNCRQHPPSLYARSTRTASCAEGRFADFSAATKREALHRQKNRCASCGALIPVLGSIGRASHPFGEGAHAHHMKHAKSCGTASVDNCVVLCESCHYSAHEGGRYQKGQVFGTRFDFPYFNG